MNVKAPVAPCPETVTVGCAPMNATVRPVREGLIIKLSSISPDRPAIDMLRELQGNQLQPVEGNVGVFQRTDSGVQFLP